MQPELRGVARDAHSLTWDAFLEPAGSVPLAGQADIGSGGNTAAGTSIVQGVRQDAVWLGKFPTREAAGRAVDLAAIKLQGLGAQVRQRPRCWWAANQQEHSFLFQCCVWGTNLLPTCSCPDQLPAVDL
jgi:hypothetical protein